MIFLDTSAIEELVNYLLLEPPQESIQHVHTQNYGDIDLLLIASTQYNSQEYYLFCEVEDDVPVIDAEGVMHLIILQGEGEYGLVSVGDAGLLHKLQDEFYCILLAEIDFDSSDAQPESLEIESATESEEEITGEPPQLLIDFASLDRKACGDNETPISDDTLL